MRWEKNILIAVAGTQEFCITSEPCKVERFFW